MEKFVAHEEFTKLNVGFALDEGKQCYGNTRHRSDRILNFVGPNKILLDQTFSYKNNC